ncbi:unnamed protein product [Onchocerca ochengi]|uniref:NADH-ubiquinone oxidoreductase chain 1 n=1 Tax=Onchocerca ochengi TaxID=42157 RepID=A0A182EPJ0_ONCOC|nr:unnamed protein product [Onchocerca ochengi]
MKKESKYSFIGELRACAQSYSYEIAFSVYLLVVLLPNKVFYLFYMELSKFNDLGFLGSYDDVLFAGFIRQGFQSSVFFLCSLFFYL